MIATDEKEPELRKRESEIPCAEWVIWYRNKKGCTLSQAFQAGLRKLREQDMQVKP